jgi:hypothetical protein
MRINVENLTYRDPVDQSASKTCCMHAQEGQNRLEKLDTFHAL